MAEDEQNEPVAAAVPVPEPTPTSPEPVSPGEAVLDVLAPPAPPDEPAPAIAPAPAVPLTPPNKLHEWAAAVGIMAFIALVFWTIVGFLRGNYF